MRRSDDEARSREVAEAARETKWQQASFLRDLFLGHFRADLVLPYPASPPERQAFSDFYARFKRFLMAEVDPAAIDETGEYPRHVIEGLAALGAFGMKIPTEYGGLGLTRREYGKVMQLLGSHDANVTALLSAHQSIGVPQPLKLFGSEAQKRKFLPRCASGTISAFALTEPSVGSDPARLSCTATPSADGKSFLLNGVKLWCTNGTIAELLVVMARTPRGISAFVVETAWPGVEVVWRCRFMGLKALANAELAFHDVVVPRENLIGREGEGLKIALTTLNTGRLTLPAATAGGAKACLEIARKWASARVQWGQPIGRHEAIAHLLAAMAATTFAMEAVADLTADLADREGYDIRLEAAAAKEWNTVRAWQIVDDTLEIRGGRGFETERSLAARGEVPIGVERMLRDARPNRIFEGSTHIMHLFMAREAVDKHLQIAGALIDAKASRRQKLMAALRALVFYAWWFPTRWLGWGRWPRFRAFGPLARHLRAIDRTSRKLGRSIFYGMLLYRARLERKQAFLFRLIDIALELYAMTAAIGRAQRMRLDEDAAGRRAEELADQFCRISRSVIRDRFRALWRNDDAAKYSLGRSVLAGEHAWLESGTVGLGSDVEDLTPRSRARKAAEAAPAPVGVEAPPPT
jgi:alkylation response protein AidB-like acyl-CoA dehydrogenase